MVISFELESIENLGEFQTISLNRFLYEWCIKQI